MADIKNDYTELFITPRSAKCWQVVIRPAEVRRLEMNEIKVIYTAKRKDLAVAFAEGRSSITGEPIRMGP